MCVLKDIASLVKAVILNCYDCKWF